MLAKTSMDVFSPSLCTEPRLGSGGVHVLGMAEQDGSEGAACFLGLAAEPGRSGCLGRMKARAAPSTPSRSSCYAETRLPARVRAQTAKASSRAPRTAATMPCQIICLLHLAFHPLIHPTHHHSPTAPSTYSAHSSSSPSPRRPPPPPCSTTQTPCPPTHSGSNPPARP